MTGHCYECADSRWFDGGPCIEHAAVKFCQTCGAEAIAKSRGEYVCEKHLDDEDYEHQEGVEWLP